MKSEGIRLFLFFFIFYGKLQALCEDECLIVIGLYLLKPSHSFFIKNLAGYFGSFHLVNFNLPTCVVMSGV